MERDETDAKLAEDVIGAADLLDKTYPTLAGSLGLCGRYADQIEALVEDYKDLYPEYPAKESEERHRQWLYNEQESPSFRGLLVAARTGMGTFEWSDLLAGSGKFLSDGLADGEEFGFLMESWFRSGEVKRVDIELAIAGLVIRAMRQQLVNETIGPFTAALLKGKGS